MYHADVSSSSGSSTIAIGGAVGGVAVLIIIVVLCILIIIKLYKKSKRKRGSLYVTNRLDTTYENNLYDDTDNTNVNAIHLQTLGTPSTPSVMVNNAISDLERTITQSSEGELIVI